MIVSAREKSGAIRVTIHSRRADPCAVEHRAPLRAEPPERRAAHSSCVAFGARCPRRLAERSFRSQPPAVSGTRRPAFATRIPAPALVWSVRGSDCCASERVLRRIRPFTRTASLARLLARPFDVFWLGRKIGGQAKEIHVHFDASTIFVFVLVIGSIAVIARAEIHSRRQQKPPVPEDPPGTPPPLDEPPLAAGKKRRKRRR